MMKMTFQEDYFSSLFNVFLLPTFYLNNLIHPHGFIDIVPYMLTSRFSQVWRKPDLFH